jgi:ferric-dicitrate binding protein FerR (iron transport regulator)
MSRKDRHIIDKQPEDVWDMNSPPVLERMRRQWDAAAPADRLPAPDDRRREKRIWRKIGKQINRRPQRRATFYQLYGAAATILLLLSLGVTFRCMTGKEKQVVNVVRSGICSIAAFTLPDGSRVSMGAASTLTYPQTFDGQTREVTLDGQAFFDVEASPGKPFVVHTAGMDVTATGTAFEIFGYANLRVQETILLEGKVKVEIAGAQTGEKQAFILRPDRLLTYDKQTGIAQIDSIDAARYTAWHNHGAPSFENETLRMILQRLEKWYGRSISCPEEIAMRYRFTFKVRDESLERILDMLGFSSAIRYRKADEDYELYIP